MASEDECHQAIGTLAGLLETVEPEVRRKYALERSVSCRVSDLGVTWSAKVSEDGLGDVRHDDDTKAQVRLTVSSDDLLSLIAGRLAVPTAIATGRLRVQANPFDLLRLGTFL